MTYREWQDPGRWLTEKGHILEYDLPRLAKSRLTTSRNLKLRNWINIVIISNLLFRILYKMSCLFIYCSGYSDNSYIFRVYYRSILPVAGISIPLFWSEVRITTSAIHLRHLASYLVYHSQLSHLSFTFFYNITCLKPLVYTVISGRVCAWDFSVTMDYKSLQHKNFPKGCSIFHSSPQVVVVVI